MIACSREGLWSTAPSPQRGPTREPRIPAGIHAVFPVVHTLYEYYDLFTLR